VDDGSFPFFTPKDLAIRTTGAPSALVADVRRIVRAVDREQPLTNVRTMTEIVAAQTETRAVQLRVLGALAFVAVVLAAVGIHGLLAFSVSERRHELGIRMILGARPSTVLASVVGQSARLAAWGLLPGAALAYAGGRAMEALLVGVAPADPVAFGVSLGVCGLMAVAGTLLPALRAVHVEPLSVIRSE
jgi:putative ABC transport system permease protein